MDLEYMGRLMLSFAIFAPGLILLAFLSFLGLIMLAERANLFRRGEHVSTAQTAAAGLEGAKNPAPGRIASALSEEIAAESAEGAEGASEDASNVRTLRKS